VNEDIIEAINRVFENEVKIVRLTCHNILRAPLYGKNLQDVVILHLENFKRNLVRALMEDSEG